MLKISKPEIYFFRVPSILPDFRPLTTISFLQPKIYECSMCPSKFSSQSRLASHFGLRHTEKSDDGNDSKNVAMQATCDLCNKVLASKYYLKVSLNK